MNLLDGLGLVLGVGCLLTLVLLIAAARAYWLVRQDVKRARAKGRGPRGKRP